MKEAVSKTDVCERAILRSLFEVFILIVIPLKLLCILHEGICK